MKPAKPDLSARLEEIEQAIELYDYPRAEILLCNALARYRSNLTIIEKLVYVYYEQDKLPHATRLLKYGLKHHPKEFLLHKALGLVNKQQGKFSAARQAYKRALAINPDCNVQHFYDAVSHNNTAIAPRKYIESLFDNYAEDFEDHLVGKLEYASPSKLAAYLAKVLDRSKAISEVIDLGCGSGLLGKALIEYFKIERLIGVDLSSKMLEECQAKNLYHTLHNEDLIEFLTKANPGVELIVATDVLIYLGDLGPVFAQAQRILKPGGYLGFTVERVFWPAYKLRPTGRYQHSSWYIKSLYKRYQFSKIYCQTIDLRKEAGKMVAGYLVLLQK